MTSSLKLSSYSPIFTLTTVSVDESSMTHDDDVTMTSELFVLALLSLAQDGLLCTKITIPSFVLSVIVYESYESL